MSILESKAVFAQRLRELGLESFTAVLQTRRLDTYGSFAYSCDYMPGSDDRTAFF